MAVSGELRIVGLQSLKSACVLANGSFMLQPGASLKLQSCHNDDGNQEEGDKDSDDFFAYFDGGDDDDLTADHATHGGALSVHKNLVLHGALVVVDCHAFRRSGGAVHVAGTPICCQGHCSRVYLD